MHRLKHASLLDPDAFARLFALDSPPPLSVLAPGVPADEAVVFGEDEENGNDDDAVYTTTDSTDKGKGKATTDSTEEGEGKEIVSGDDNAIDPVDKGEGKGKGKEIVSDEATETTDKGKAKETTDPTDKGKAEETTDTVDPANDERNKIKMAGPTLEYAFPAHSHSRSLIIKPHRRDQLIGESIFARSHGVAWRGVSDADLPQNGSRASVACHSWPLPSVLMKPTRAKAI